MGQHTWFEASLELENKIENLYKEADKLYETKTKTGFHDLFRSEAKTKEGYYIEDVKLTSYDETIKWIKDPKNKIRFSRTKFDTKEEVENYKKECYKQLEEFWNKYPNGVIRFG